MTKTVSTVMLFLLVMGMLTLTLRIQPVRAADVDEWPMFHHDLSHTGTSTSTGPTTNNTIWNYTTGNYVDSSPAVVGGLVYIGSYDDNVYCLNATNGTQVWNYTTGGNVFSSPAVVGGLVYLGSEDDNVYCLNATTGALVWKYKTGDYVEYSSPAVVGGLVYIGSDDYNVYCLNATTGALVWKYKTGNYVKSSPAVVGGIVYIGSADGNVYCLNATTGAFVWSCTTVGSVSYSSPAVVKGVVYVGSEDGKIYAFGPSSTVPEFPPYLILPLFMMTTLLAAFVFLKRKRNVRTQSGGHLNALRTFLRMSQLLIDRGFDVARVLVPKLVKNGVYSSLAFSGPIQGSLIGQY